jgi:hypothetical protein
MAVSAESLDLWGQIPALTNDDLAKVLRAHYKIRVFSAPCVWETVPRTARASARPRSTLLPCSRNSITSLSSFSLLPHLKELYLPNNSICEAGLGALSSARWVPALTHLWLESNPCAASPLYRDFCVAFLPTLEKLDTSAILPEERARLCVAGERARLRAALGGGGAAAGGEGAAPLGGAPPPQPPPTPPPLPPPRCAHQPSLLAAATLLLGELDEAALTALGERVAQALTQRRA